MHVKLDTAAFVDAASRPVGVVKPDLDASHQPLQAPKLPAKHVRDALLPKLSFEIVGAKAKLHDQLPEKLQQLDFVAIEESTKAAVS